MYSHKGDQYPLGYKNSAVRVVFTHSAPNNLPAILHRQVYNNFRPDKQLGLTSQKWKALFPGRTLPISFKQDISTMKEYSSPRHETIKILETLYKESKSREQLASIMNKTSSYIQHILDLCIRLELIEPINQKLVITDKGKMELVSKSLIRRRLDRSCAFYYPQPRARL